jgi:AraC family transcriptional regulator of adaptative response/methylated-DNA-[protein]-cysteine methyltransferase
MPSLPHIEVSLSPMAASECRRGGEALAIAHGVADTPFGPALLAWTPRGLCHLGFVDHEPGAATAEALRQRWPRAGFTPEAKLAQARADAIFGAAPAPSPMALHVAGTNFQHQVWRALLGMGPGQLSSYGELARRIGRPAASRAVGQALGANPVGYLIPCHRVTQHGGAIGGYRWGVDRKRAMLAREAAQALSDCVGDGAGIA